MQLEHAENAELYADGGYSANALQAIQAFIIFINSERGFSPSELADALGRHTGYRPKAETAGGYLNAIKVALVGHPEYTVIVGKRRKAKTWEHIYIPGKKK